MKTSPAFDVLFALMTGVMLAFVLIAHAYRPSALTLIYNWDLYIAALSIAISFAVVGFLAHRRSVHSERTKATFGALLIACSCTLYSSLDLIHADVSLWQSNIYDHYEAISAAIVFLSLSKNAMSFGVAAIGAGLVSTYITSKSSSVHK